MRSKLGCFIFLMIIMTSQIFAGSVYYVDATNGNDANPGTEFLPWRTIQKAGNTMIAGDSVIVKGGTYNERVTESTSGSPGNLITYQVKSGDIVTVYGFNLNGNYIKIDGFKCDPPAGNCSPPNSTGVYVTGDYCEVWNCYIYQAPKYGIRVWLDSSYCKIMNNYLYQCGDAGIEVSGDHHLVEGNEVEDTRCAIKGCTPGHANGMRFFGTNHIFRGNYIHDINYDNNPGYEPHIDGWHTWSDQWHPVGTDCLFEKNVIVLPVSKTAAASGTAFQLQGAINIIVKNNIIKAHVGVHPYAGATNITIVNNAIIGDLTLNGAHYPCGITVRDNADGITIKNNIICEYPTHAIYIDETCTNVVADYNCTYNSNGSIPWGTPQLHDLWGINPKLINLAGAKQSGGDEHLQSDSPCIDTGSTLAEVMDDFDGKSRPYGAWYDIGAYEYVGENPPLNVNINGSPTSGYAPLTVNFTGNPIGGTPPYTYSWDFGDGQSSSEQDPSHTYNDAGDYTITLTVTDSQSIKDEDSVIINALIDEAYLSCSPTSLYFGATTPGNETTDQYLRIINAGSGVLTWNIEDDADWLSCSPSSGTDRGEITVSVNASGLSLGRYTATITVSSPKAYNSPQYVSVNFRVYEPEQESPPFGSLDTPVDGSTVSGRVPITGRALDDDEIGARYFFIDNIETGSAQLGSFGSRSIYREDAEGRLRVGIKEVRREYRPQADDGRDINIEDILKIQIEEMEPLRIVFEGSSEGNIKYIGWGENKSKALPVGSTLDREKGIFSWIPTPGFIGSYVLHFAVTDGSYMSKPLRVVVDVIPKSYE